MYCITVPKKNATTTDNKMPAIIARTLAVLRYSATFETAAGLVIVFMVAIATDAPKSSNINETVVEVGNPKLLNASNMTTSVIMAARKMNITSLK